MVTASALVISANTLAGEFPSVAEARQLLCRGENLRQIDTTLTKEQAKTIAKLSGDKVRERRLKVWVRPEGGAFFIDRVKGKHEWITYAATVDSQARVQGVEILDYRETYGYEIANKSWRSQFNGKKASADTMRFDKDIQNISGATISCRNITRGLRRLSVTYDLVIRPLAQ